MQIVLVLATFLGALILYQLLLKFLRSKGFFKKEAKGNVVGILMMGIGVGIIFGGVFFILLFLDKKYETWDIFKRLTFASFMSLIISIGYILSTSLAILIRRLSGGRIK